MNKADAAQVLAILSAPHGFVVEPDTMAVWYQAALERMDPETATAVAVRLVETVERFPTPAAFNAMAKTIERERYLAHRDEQAQAEGRLLHPGVAMPDKVRQIIADLRSSMGTGDTRGHNHKGPDACPICGGINPDVLRQLPPEQRQRIEMVQEQRRARRRADSGSLG